MSKTDQWEIEEAIATLAKILDKDHLESLIHSLEDILYRPKEKP